MSTGERRRYLVALLATSFALSVAASVMAGTPAPVPSLALGWNLLLHLERATAVLALAGTLALIGWRAINGQFPVRVGQVEYPTAADQRPGITLEQLYMRICCLEEAVAPTATPGTEGELDA